MSGGLDGLSHGISRGIDAVASQSVFGCLAFFLALVFALSAVPKIRKPDLAALAIVDFGVMTKSRRWAGMALGLGEIGLAGALVVAATAPAGVGRILPPVLGATVLWTFVALIVRALQSPERFACFCFGAADSAISSRTLIRTLGLAAVASAMAAAAFQGASPTGTEMLTLQLTIAASVLGSIVVLTRIPSILEVTS